MAELLWSYKAEDASGKVVRGQVHSATEAIALARLKSDGLLPLAIKQRPHEKGIRSQILFSMSKLSLQDYVSILRGLADLLSAGVSLTDALELLAARQHKEHSKRFLESQLKKVRAGIPFSESLEQDKIEVPRLIPALVAAGEASGSLTVQLTTLADTFEVQAKLRREIISQLIYPLALCVLIVLTLVFLSYFVLPQFESIFAGSDTLPPSETQFVLAAGAFIRSYGVFVPFVLFGCAILFTILRQRYKYQVAAFLLRLPSLGRFLLKADTGRYCRAMGSLLTGGTSLSKAFPIAIRSVASPVLAKEHEEAAAAIRAGQPFSKVMEQSSLMPDTVLGLVEIGEKSGRLGPMLIKAAGFCESDNRNFLNRLAALAGPVLTALMGLITAVVIASVMSGVLSLNEAVY